MDIKANAQDGSQRVFTSLLAAGNGGVLLPKQDVVGSNPISRSILQDLLQILALPHWFPTINWIFQKADNIWQMVKGGI